MLRFAVACVISSWILSLSTVLKTPFPVSIKRRNLRSIPRSFLRIPTGNLFSSVRCSTIERTDIACGIQSKRGIRWNDYDAFLLPEIGDLCHLVYDPYAMRHFLTARDFFLPESVHERFQNEEWEAGTSIGLPNDGPVRLKFEMHNAKIYSFWFI